MSIGRYPGATPALFVTRIGETVSVTVAIPASLRTGQTLELRIASERNDRISAFSDRSEFAPVGWTAGPDRGQGQVYYPVVDLVPDESLEAVFVFQGTGEHHFRLNPALHDLDSLASPSAALPVRYLEFWENDVCVSSAASKLDAFYVRRRFDGSGGVFDLSLRLLSADWSGGLSL